MIDMLLTCLTINKKEFDECCTVLCAIDGLSEQSPYQEAWKVTGRSDNRLELFRKFTIFLTFRDEKEQEDMSSSDQAG
jgi:hypothetical protein